MRGWQIRRTSAAGLLAVRCIAWLGHHVVTESSLREMFRVNVGRRLGLRVKHDLANLLRAPACFGKPARPSKRFLSRSHLDDRKPTDNRLLLRKGTVGDGPVGRDNAGLLAWNTATEDPNPSSLGVSGDGVSRFPYRWQVIV